MPQDHSYEEIRSVVLDILAGRERVSYEPSQYTNIETGVGEVFGRREGQSTQTSSIFGGERRLSAHDADLFMEVFWDLFRQSILTLGHDRANKEFPFCRVSHVGKRILENQQVYFFHDVSTYESLIKTQIPSIDDALSERVDASVSLRLHIVVNGNAGNRNGTYVFVAAGKNRRQS